MSDVAHELPEGAEKAANKHLWTRHPDDWYVEDQRASEALFAVERFTEGEIYDPACGRGNILVSAKAAGYPNVHGSDIERRSELCSRNPVDFLVPTQGPIRAWNIVTNPPFKYCGKAGKFKFIENALLCARVKSAFLLPATWKNSAAAATFCEGKGLYKIYDLVPRISMPPGPVIEAGIDPGGGTTDFSWFVFLNGYQGPWVTQPLFWKNVSRGSQVPA